MKKRTLFLTLALTMTMSMTSLTGCGDQKETAEEQTAVENTVSQEEDQAEVETEDTINLENDIIEFDDSDSIPEYILSDMEFEANTGDLNEKYGFTDKHIVQSFEATKEVPVYSEEGIRVGYVKEGATIDLK